jgi:DNA-binding transcriptional ArsR family regulator
VAPGQWIPAPALGKISLPVLDCTPLDLSQPTVSHHLRVLFEAGLLERERRGNWVYYRAVPGALEGVLEALGGRSQAPGGSSAAYDDDCRCS